MIDKIISELEKMEARLNKLQAQIDWLRAHNSPSRITFLEGEYEGISWAHLQLKRLIDQTPEGRAWERGQGDKTNSTSTGDN